MPGETRTRTLGPRTVARGTVATSTSASSDIGNTSGATRLTVGSHSRSWIDCGVAFTDPGTNTNLRDGRAWAAAGPAQWTGHCYPKNRPESCRGWHLPQLLSHCDCWTANQIMLKGVQQCCLWLASTNTVCNHSATSLVPWPWVRCLPNPDTTIPVQLPCQNDMPPLISTNRSAPSLNFEVNSKMRLVSSKLRAS